MAHTQLSLCWPVSSLTFLLISLNSSFERQVGVAGYRIDLAILSEDGAKRELGIECDGWTYHSEEDHGDR